MVLVDEVRSYEPLLARFKLLNGLEQFLVVVRDHRADDIAGIPYATDLETCGTVAQFLAEVGAVVDGAFHEEKRAGRALLSGIAES